MKHTPGPWKVMYATDDEGISCLAVWHHGTKEGTIGTPICKVSPESSVNENDQANASLIAAAPKMYNMLLESKEALQNLGRTKCFHSGDDPCMCTLCKINRVLEEASFEQKMEVESV